MQLDEMLATKVEPDSPARFLEHHGQVNNSRAKSMLDRVVSQQNRHSTPFELAVKGKSLLAGARDIYSPAFRSDHTVPNALLRAVMSGLRMAGIDKRHPEYKALYQNTYRTVSFAVRNNTEMSAVDLQVMVDKVLSLFLSKEW
jgi:UDP-N-acetyl-D-mannosaminuronate dehydrogenase